MTPMIIKGLKYNYIVYGTWEGLYQYSYADLNGYSNVVRHPGYIQSLGPMYRLYRTHMSTTINAKFPLPFKQVWFSRFNKVSFKDEKPVCCVFCGTWARLAAELGLNDYLKKRFKYYKSVSFFQDLMKIQKNYTRTAPIDVDLYKRTFDLMLSFDQGDSEKYGFIYHPLVYSKYKGDIKEMPYSDVYFLGKAKDRLKEILEAYKVLRETGLKLDFYITGVKPQDQQYADEIHYNESMEYAENLQHILHTKCLLDIMQKGGLGYTQRVVEVLCENKMLLTNNDCIESDEFFNPQYMSRFKNASDIDTSFLESIRTVKDIDYGYRDNISPIELIHFIDERL